ncbi:MAG: hypothetical protein JRI36_07220 [Deltaproteobacteria bacterium]|nr:hypothetical protein [Deltaproteobacteria bacterium]
MSDTTAGGSENGHYKPFTMTSFDEPETPKPEYPFEVFYGDTDSASLPFEALVADTVDEARKVLDNAHRIVDEAKARASTVEQEAYEKGFSQGERDGKEMGAKKLDKLLDNIKQVFEEITAYKDDFTKQHEKHILDLVFRIAEKVVHAKIDTDSTVVRETILKAFELMADRSHVTVKVSPADMEYVKELRAQFFETIQDLKSITVEGDPKISPGGCLLETDFGHVDARIDTQLDQIRTAIQQAYAQEQTVS